MLPNTLTSTTSFIDLLLDAVCVVDAEGRFVYVSAACERIFGYRQDEMVGMQMIDLVAPEDRERTLETARRIMAGHPMPHFENRYVRKDGRIVHILWSARWSEAEQVRIAVAHDITASKRTEAMQAALYAISEAAHSSGDVLALVRQIHATVGTLLPAPGFSVALAGADGSLDFAYHADQIGQPPVEPSAVARALCADVIGLRAPVVLGPDQPGCAGDPALCSWLGVPLNTESDTIGVLAVHSGPGCTPFSASDTELLQFVSTQVATAIQRKKLHARLSHMAQYDELTGLPNRRLLYDRIETSIARARRQQGCLAVLYLDLDGFKKVNDMFGHAVGDLVLREVSGRLMQCVRGVDTVARLGGDEFVVLLDSVVRYRDASLVADKIRDVVRQPMDIGENRSLRMTPSVGIALYPEHGATIEQLFRYADAAMYAAKNNPSAA
ncbi:MAG TPA: diguanylate cyclase [Telluria sp.]|nr:diguanylate cyclase [Telluria sp.]